MTLRRAAWLDQLRAAALEMGQVRGLTHNFYRYPARFSPQFVGSAIELFSRPGELVLDPFMGGGTTILEAYARGRNACGVDLNQLAEFVVRAKTTSLSKREMDEVRDWLVDVLLSFNYATSKVSLESGESTPAKNLSGPTTRPIRKALLFALAEISSLSSARARRFTRCVLLRTSQWALDGRRETPRLGEFRDRVVVLAEEMFGALGSLRAAVRTNSTLPSSPRIYCGLAQGLPTLPRFRDGMKADLVVTSPPYPGVHVLYHRWQIQGRRETSAPYWIADCKDGKGTSYYNFGGRHDPQQDDYFRSYADSLRAIRAVLKPGGIMVQMVACKRPDLHLSRISAEVAKAGFAPHSPDGAAAPIVRAVPGRKWHANLRGQTPSSYEHVMVHVAE